MPIYEQLLWRAIRMLTDDYAHEAAALAWASRMVAANKARAETLLAIGFTPRELSLGAERW